MSEKLNKISRDNGFEWVNYVLGMTLVGYGTHGVLEGAVRTYYYVVA